MQPLRFARRCLPLLTLAATLMLLSSVALAQDATITGTLNYVSGLPGAEVYQYDYTVTNLAIEPTIQTVIIFFDSDTLTGAFDGSDDCDFVSATGPTGDWEVTPFEYGDPDAWYVEFGNYSTLGPAPDEELATFSIRILWKNPDTVPAANLFFEAMNGWSHEGVTETCVETTAPRNSVISGHVYACCCQPPPPHGGCAVSGGVTPQCWGGHFYSCECLPQAGVTIDLYKGDVLVASMLTNAAGEYSFSVQQAAYTVNIVTPLGYYIKNEVPNAGNGPSLDFYIGCVRVENRPQTVCYWKHEASVIVYGCVRPPIPKTTFVSYLDLIYNHFTLHAIHPIPLYNLPPTTLAITKIKAAQDILSVPWCGSYNMDAKARSELFALMLNVAGLKIAQSAVISWDGAQVNQAITYAWDLIATGLPENLNQAYQICGTINNGRKVMAGRIPLDTPIILYEIPGPDAPAVTPVVTALELGQNYPNPFNPSTMIPFSVPSDGFNTPVRLEIFDMSGRLVRTLVNDVRDGGEYVASWDGNDDSGSPAASGIYVYSLTAGAEKQTRKLHLLK